VAERTDQVGNGEKPIRVVFYAGAYGPTLRVCIDSARQLERVKRMFSRFAHARLTDGEFAALVNGATYEQLSSWKIELVQRGLPRKGLVKVSASSPAPAFVWSLPPDGWRLCLELIDAFGTAAGHQYLTTEGVDDALVEVAYLEWE
jgi:hypothetical protein